MIPAPVDHAVLPSNSELVIVVVEDFKLMAPPYVDDPPASSLFPAVLLMNLQLSMIKLAPLTYKAPPRLSVAVEALPLINAKLDNSTVLVPILNILPLLLASITTFSPIPTMERSLFIANPSTVAPSKE